MIYLLAVLKIILISLLTVPLLVVPLLVVPLLIIRPVSIEQELHDRGSHITVDQTTICSLSLQILMIPCKELGFGSITIKGVALYDNGILTDFDFSVNVALSGWDSRCTCLELEVKAHTADFVVCWDIVLLVFGVFLFLFLVVSLFLSDASCLGWTFDLPCGPCRPCGTSALLVEVSAENMRSTLT
jgi:hypothetical protein